MKTTNIKCWHNQTKQDHKKGNWQQFQKMNVQTRFFPSEKAGEQNRNRQTNNRNKQTNASVCSGEEKEKTYHIPLYKDLKEFNRNPSAWQV